MKLKYIISFLFVLMIYSLGFSQVSTMPDNVGVLKKEVWSVVEKRNSSWTNNDFEGHMSIYHPEFRRWSLHSKELLTKEMFASFWDNIKKNEATKEIKIERQEMQILQDGNLAIAHYTIYEDYTWIGDVKTSNYGQAHKKGDKLKGVLRFSDIYLLEDGKWFYVGGHRDGAYLK